MNKKTECYISYCQNDISPEKMKIIVEWMKSLCEDQIEFLFDLNVIYGESFDDFEDKIFDVDAIIIFFTQNYKKRCLDETDTGDHREYRKILTIIEENRNNLHKVDSNNTYFKERKLLYSILYKGDAESSITLEFQKLKYLDVSKSVKFAENRNHQLSLAQVFTEKYENSFVDILSEILTAFTEKTNKFYNDYNKIFKDLFINTKSEHIDLPQELFVETDAYKKVLLQQKYLIIGRKGSGKTTVKNTISSIVGEEYKGIIAIIADKFSIDETYQTLFNNSQLYSDVKSLFTEVDTYKILWHSFIILYCIFVVVKECLNGRLSSKVQYKYIDSLKVSIFQIFHINDESRILSFKDEEITKTLYFYTLTNLENYIKLLIKNSRDDLQFYETDIKSKYTIEYFLRYLIEDKTYNDFYEILKHCKRKIFITLDGFDVNFELFKKTTVRLEDVCEKNRRINFEILWLMIFIETLLELKANSELKDVIDLCLTLPVDRIETIKNNNRDFYKYHAYTVALSWKSSDLVKVITQRLKKLNSITTNSIDVNFETELDYLMDNYYPKIPSSIQFERNGYINMPIFLYILRKSFWRPRDIIRYYGCILSLNENQKDIDNISIKRAIKDESIRIIQDEFFGEFSNLYTNLKEIIDLFQFQEQVLTYEQMYSILKNHAIIIDGNITQEDFVAKLKILYVIGFLGIKLNKNFIEAQYLYDEYAFIFTEGTSLLRVLDTKGKIDCKFVVHPIFTEYLFLQVDYNNLICNYTWEYVNNINCNNIDYIMDEN